MTERILKPIPATGATLRTGGRAARRARRIGFASLAALALVGPTRAAAQESPIRLLRSPDRAVRLLESAYEPQVVLVGRTAADRRAARQLPIDFSISRGLPDRAPFEPLVPSRRGATASTSFTRLEPEFDFVNVGVGCDAAPGTPGRTCVAQSFLWVSWLRLFDDQVTAQPRFRFALPNPVPAGVAAAGARCFQRPQVGAEQEPNDSPSQADRIVLQGEIEGQISSPRDVDVATFDAPGGNLLRIQSTVEGLEGLDMRLIGPDGERVIDFEFSSGTSVGRISIQDTGTYTLVMSGTPENSLFQNRYKVDVRLQQDQLPFIAFDGKPAIDVEVPLSAGEGLKDIACDFTSDAADDFRVIASLTKPILFLSGVGVSTR